MAEVIRTHRRGRIWPAFVMLLVVLLLIGLIVAMVMNLRGSISWPAGRVEFGFRPNIFVTKTEPVNVVAPSRLAVNIERDSPATSVSPPEPETKPVPDVAPEQAPAPAVQPAPEENPAAPAQ